MLGTRFLTIWRGGNRHARRKDIYDLCGTALKLETSKWTHVHLNTYRGLHIKIFINKHIDGI